MGKLIQIGKSAEDTKPRVICPHCKQQILIDIKPFSKDVSKILQDKCPKCRGTIFVGVLILCHPDFQGILSCLELIINTVNTKNKLLL